jgi:hypothetical protein
MKLERYFKRTIEHIHRVQNNMLLLVTGYAERLDLSPEECREAIHSVLNHDRSKFSPEQFVGYVELTDYYFRRNNGEPDYDYPEAVKPIVDGAWQNHYKVENHHPERFKGTIGKYGRLEAYETACDLQAMAQEFNEGSARKYFETNWKPRMAQYFYDDFNWVEVTQWMSDAIECFEDAIEAAKPKSLDVSSE